MPFRVNVAADIDGVKQNLELSLAEQPTGLADLEAGVVEGYGVEFGRGKLSLSRLQLFDEATSRWVDVIDVRQVRDFAQLYAFNRLSHEETKPIPPPRPLLHGGVLAPSHTLPPEATHDQKVAAVFGELDVSGNRVIESDEWRRGVRMLRLDLPPATVADLFMRADMDGDQVISWGEWERFCEVFPTLLDCMYYRARDYWEDFRQHQVLRASEDELEALKADEAEAHRAHLAAQESTAVQENRLAAAEQQLKLLREQEDQAEARSKEAIASIDFAARDKERRAKAVDDARAEGNAIAAREAQTKVQVERLESELSKLLAEQAELQEKERGHIAAEDDARRILAAAQQRDAEKEAARRELADKEAATRGALGAAERALEDANIQQRRLESELQGRESAEREQEVRLRDAHGDLGNESQSLDSGQSAVDGLTQAAASARTAMQDAQRALAEAEERGRQQEEARLAALARRRQIEEQERPLLEQEFRLRDQRGQLEEREARLRLSATACRTARVSTPA